VLGHRVSEGCVLRLIPELAADRPLSVLCLGAHSDDIEIGCGGTVLRLLSEHPGTEVHWVVFAAKGLRATEAERSANRFLAGAGRADIVLNEFKDGFFPYVGADIKQFFEELKQRVSPDLILTHCRQDLHQDHRLISELTWNTFRNHLIFEYEIVKYDGDLGAPNMFVHLDAAVCRAKVDNLLQCFDSQRARAWFSEDTFYAMLRLRGVESSAPDKYAEAFYCRKMVC
jgi:LmbE family N-acetylglucosaminyl deacetylase